MTQEPLIAEIAVAADRPTRTPVRVQVDEPVASRARMSPQRLRVPVDVTAATVGMLVAGAGVANLVYAVLLMATLVRLGTYRKHLHLSVLTELPRLVLATAFPLGLLAPLSPWVDLPSSLYSQALISGVGIAVGRGLAYAVLRGVRRHDPSRRDRVVIIGTGDVGLELGRQLTQRPQYGLEVVGYVDDLDDLDESGEVDDGNGPPLLGRLGDLEEVIGAVRARRVIVAFGPSASHELVAILRSAVLHDTEVYVVPRFFELGLTPAGPDVELVWGIPLARVRRAALRVTAFRLKRAADVVLSGLLLVLLAPVLAATGREIEVLKFRTLSECDDADVTWTVAEDPRRTRTGAFLRRTSLDELPQLWNVLRGDMALVGPRPERPYFVSRFSAQVPRYADRHRLPVGLTGLAQVHDLRGDTSIEERARFDNYYIEHWTPWEDVKIAALTVLMLIRDGLGLGGAKDR
jgi:lipopolysaccharide/colanic/teichoic acid biosynthesis glycosyltransferase